MTAADAARLIGRQGYLKLDGISVLVEVLDVRERYGNTDYKIWPIGGSGNKWVISERVDLIIEENA